MGASGPVIELMKPTFTCAAPTPGRARDSAASSASFLVIGSLLNGSGRVQQADTDA